MRRAFAEAGVEPELIVSCSGGTIWGSMWAAGMSAQEMADFSLSWRLQDYLDIQWAKLPRYALGALKGFTGMGKGAAIDRTFTERVGEAVDVRGHLYVDGGIIDLIPAGPILRDGGFDRVFAVNLMLPPQLEAQDITGWQHNRMGILQASRQADQGFQLELARRTRAALGDRLTIIDAADHRLLRGPAFYDLFIDRSRCGVALEARPRLAGARRADRLPAPR